MGGEVETERLWNRNVGNWYTSGFPLWSSSAGTNNADRDYGETVKAMGVQGGEAKMKQKCRELEYQRFPPVVFKCWY